MLRGKNRNIAKYEISGPKINARLISIQVKYSKLPQSTQRYQKIVNITKK